MKTTIKEITPAWAKQILETRNIQNRHKSDSVVDKYANDMIAGNWCLTHQGIAFDENGDLLDGQHRLAAVLKSNRNIQMLVTTGIPSSFKNNGHTTSVFTAIDGLRPRTPATALELLKFKNCKMVASTARSLAFLGVGMSRKMAVSGANVLEIVRACGGSVEKICSLSTGAPIVRVKTGALACIAFWHTTKPAEAEAFLLECQSVTGAVKSPSRSLARWISNSVSGGGQVTTNLIYVASSAIKHHVEGNTAEKLYGSEDAIKWLRSTNRPLASKILAMFKL